MLIMGIGYRLLPMLLPAAAPRGWSTGERRPSRALSQAAHRATHAPRGVDVRGGEAAVEPGDAVGRVATGDRGV